MTRRPLFTLLCSTLALLLALPAMADDVPDGFSEVVVLALEEAKLKEEAQVESGHVVANDDSSKLEFKKNTSIAGSFNVGVLGEIIGSLVVGDELKIGDDATVGGDAYYNDLDNTGTILGSEITPVDLPFFATLPQFRTGTPGNQDVGVDEDETQTLAAGDYRKVEVEKDATLIFSGGVYNIESLSADDRARLLFEAPTEVRIDKDFDSKEQVEIGSAPGAGVSASRIIFFVNGGKMEIEKESDVAANFYAPYTTIKIKERTTATGAFIGSKVEIEKDVVLSLASFFNEAPEPADDSASTLEGGTVAQLDGGAASVLDNDDDPNADDTLTVTTPQVSGPGYGTLLLNSDGTFSYTHDSSENFVDMFVYEVCDDGNPVECATATVVISITPVNDPPTVDTISDPAAIDEDAAEQIVNLSGITQGGGGSETAPAPQFPLTVTASSDNTGLIPDPAVSYDGTSTTGSLAYTPVADQSGSAVITVTVKDSAGTANGGADTTTTSFTVVVNPVNDPPVVNDQSLTTDTQTLIVIDLTGSDIEGNNLSYSLVSPFDNPAIGSTSAFDSGPPVTTTFLPSGDGETGTGSFVYQACDDGSPSECAQATVTIEVVAFNSPPIADSQGVDSTNNPQLITLTGSDLPDNGLDFSLVSGPLNGSLSGLPQNNVASNSVVVSYGPNIPGDPDSFAFRVCDNDTPEKCSVGVVTINSDEPLNNPPTADDQILATNGDVDLAVTLTASDPDAGDTLSFSILSGPTAGALSGVPPTVTYNPNTAEDAEDAFTFEVCDDATPMLCDNGTVFINASNESENDAPTPQADAIRVAPGGTATTLFPAGTSLLTNDSDPNGNNLAVTETPVSEPDHGSLTLETDGTFSYTHSGDGSMSDQFAYEVCDDHPTDPLCASATAFIQIQPPFMSVSVTVSGAGSVTSSPSGIDCGANCSASFDTAEDLPIDLFATPDAGYLFAGWAGSTDCSDGVLSVAADASCIATFSALPPPGDPFVATVELAGLGSGSVASSPDGIDCPAECQETFVFGTRVTLDAFPEDNSSFAGFSGDADCLDGVLDGTSSATCTATFDLLPEEQWTLTIAFDGAGAGDVTSADGGIGCDEECSAVFGDGETVVLNARASNGSTFGGYGAGCGSVSGFKATIVMGADTTCTVTFNQNPE